MTATSASARKVAALIASVDRPTAERLLAKLPKEKAREVLAAARQLGDLSERERREAVEDFRRQTSRPAATSPRIAAPAIGEDHEIELSISPEAKRLSASTGPPSAFRFLEEASDDELFDCMRGENAQIAAVVLSHLSPARGGRLLQSFDESARAAAMERFSSLDDSDADLARDAETEIATLLRERLANLRKKARRLDRLREILRAAGLDGQELQAKAEALAASDERDPIAATNEADSPFNATASLRTARIVLPRTAEAPSDDEASDETTPEERAQRFSQLFRLSSGSLAALCERTPLPRLLAALAGAEPEDVDVFAATLPKREAKIFREQLREILPLSLLEIERAQAELLDVAERLADEGLI